MRIAPEYVDKYASPPSYEDAMRYASMPPSVQTQSYPNVTVQQLPDNNNVSNFTTDVPLHEPTLRRK